MRLLKTFVLKLNKTTMYFIFNQKMISRSDIQYRTLAMLFLNTWMRKVLCGTLLPPVYHNVLRYLVLRTVYLFDKPWVMFILYSLNYTDWLLTTLCLKKLLVYVRIQYTFLEKQFIWVGVTIDCEKCIRIYWIIFYVMFDLYRN